MNAWSADDVRATAWRRGDGRWQVAMPDDADAATWVREVADAVGQLDGDVLLHVGHPGSPQLIEQLQDLGFAVTRSELLWRIPVLPALRTRPRPGVEIVGVLDVDPADAAALDTRIRQDVPGTAGWTTTTQDFLDTLADDEFDPRLYRVARTSDGELLGLIRVWDRTPRPRIGCLAVLPQARRGAVAAMLVDDVAGELRRRGVTEVITETDAHNTAVVTMARRLGGHVTGGTTELVRPARR